MLSLFGFIREYKIGGNAEKANRRPTKLEDVAYCLQICRMKNFPRLTTFPSIFTSSVDDFDRRQESSASRKHEISFHVDVP